MNKRPTAVRKVPRNGFTVGGKTVDKSSERIIDVNKAIGATEDISWQAPQTGYSIIIEHENDITDNDSGNKQKSNE